MDLQKEFDQLTMGINDFSANILWFRLLACIFEFQSSHSRKNVKVLNTFMKIFPRLRNKLDGYIGEDGTVFFIENRGEILSNDVK